MKNYNYQIRICEATNAEIHTHNKKCAQTHTVSARKTKENEPGEFAFQHPRGIDEITYAFENYVEMRKNNHIFHVDKIIKYPN